MQRSMEAPVDPHFGDPGLPLLEAELPADSDWDYLEGFGPVPPPDAGPILATPVQAVVFSLEEAAAAQHAGNRAMAAQLSALAAALDTSRRNLSVYLLPGGLAERDAAELAARAAALDAALRLNLTPNQVRIRAFEGQTLQDFLPQLWEQFRTGLTTYAHAQAAVQHVTGLTDPAAIARYDTVLAGAATQLTPAAFRQKARTLQGRLLAEPLEKRHARAAADRRVYLEPIEDGMAWLHALISAPDAIRITARLRSTARNTAKKEKAAARKAGTNPAGRRTQMQIRADLAVAWLAGDGTPTAAKVRPILLVPILSLLGTGTDPAILHGYGPIDPATAAKLFADAPAFRKVGTDPINGEILDLDRGRYRPTKAQCEWLSLKYGTCARPGCTCQAREADIDHVREWARDHGPTNIDNLLPLCTPDHRLKTLSKINISNSSGCGPDAGDGDDTVTVTTPTGHTSRGRPQASYGADPPF